jgi:serine/threonine protein kinase
LKPANILVNEDCSVKICDFGLARSIAGIESAQITSSKRFKDDQDTEMKSESSHDDVHLSGVTETAKLHHQDSVSTTSSQGS